MVLQMMVRMVQGAAFGLALLVGLMLGLAVGMAKAEGAVEGATAIVAPESEAVARLEKRMKSNPSGVLADAAAAVTSAMASAPAPVAGLDAAGAARVVNLGRARLRGAALGEMLAADLDNDGAVSAAESAAYLPLLSAPDRADRALALALADANGDGTADAAELRAGAEALAQAKLDPAEAGAVAALLTLDGDGDGVVTLAEARAVLAPNTLTPAALE